MAYTLKAVIHGQPEKTPFFPVDRSNPVRPAQIALSPAIAGA